MQFGLRVVFNFDSSSFWRFLNNADARPEYRFQFGDGGYGLNDLAFVDPTSGALIHGSAASATSGGGDDLPAGLGTLYLTDDGGSTWFSVSIGD